MKRVLMERGPLTFQWRPCVVVGRRPQVMDRERRFPQVATVTNVPDHVTPGDVMRQMERTAWSPDTTSLTEVDYRDLGLGEVICAAQTSRQARQQA